jgi:hypothetical protein
MTSGSRREAHVESGHPGEQGQVDELPCPCPLVSAAGLMSQFPLANPSAGYDRANDN